MYPLSLFFQYLLFGMVLGTAAPRSVLSKRAQMNYHSTLHEGGYIPHPNSNVDIYVDGPIQGMFNTPVPPLEGDIHYGTYLLSVSAADEQRRLAQGYNPKGTAQSERGGWHFYLTWDMNERASL